MKRPLSVLALLASAGAAAAQEAAPAAPEAVPALANPTFLELFRAGGPLMWLLLAFSVFALAVVAWLFATLRAGAAAPRALVRDAMDKIRQGDLGEARKICEDRPCPFAHLALAAIDAARSLPSGDAAALSAAVEGEGSRQADTLRSRAQWLLDIATVAPLVGLLGTVLGFFAAFRGIGSDLVASAKPVVLAQGVALAIVTTIAGLLVAIPCLLFYAWFRRAAERRVAALECLASDLVTVLLSRRGATR
jgi:biopolymer transport protein ExbB